MKQLIKYIHLFIIGGLIYEIIETLYRGYSHWTMGILGGVCFITIGLVNEIISWDISIWKQALIGCIIITSLEFITGYIVNVKLGWNIWDYSNLPFNIYGQICLPFSFLWYFLSIFAIVLDDYLRYWFFNEEKPHYNFK